MEQSGAIATRLAIQAGRGSPWVALWSYAVGRFVFGSVVYHGFGFVLVLLSEDNVVGAMSATGRLSEPVLGSSTSSLVGGVCWWCWDRVGVGGLLGLS